MQMFGIGMYIFRKKYNLDLDEISDMFFDVAINQRLWNMTTMFAKLKIILDEVVKGSNHEWQLTDLEFGTKLPSTMLHPNENSM